MKRGLDSEKESGFGFGWMDDNDQSKSGKRLFVEKSANVSIWQRYLASKLDILDWLVRPINPSAE